MADNKEKLFDQFPPVTTEEWRAKVEVDLKGADFNKKLVWRTNEGFNVQPMYRAEDIKDLKTTDSLPGEYPFVRGTKTDNDWYVRQEIEVSCPKEANEKALEILGKGVTSLGFTLKEDLDAEGIKTLLSGIDVAKVEINFNCCPNKALQLATDLVAYIKAANATDTFKGAIGFDPFRRLLKHGKDFPKDIKEIAVALVEVAADVKGLRVLAVNSDKLCNAGAYIYRFWTGSFRLISTCYKYNPVTILHVPAEKEYGMLKLYNKYISKGKIPTKKNVYRLLHLNRRSLRTVVAQIALKLGK